MNDSADNQKRTGGESLQSHGSYGSPESVSARIFQFQLKFLSAVRVEHQILSNQLHTLNNHHPFLSITPHQDKARHWIVHPHSSFTRPIFLPPLLPIYQFASCVGKTLMAAEYSFPFFAVSFPEEYVLHVGIPPPGTSSTLSMPTNPNCRNQSTSSFKCILRCVNPRDRQNPANEQTRTASGVAIPKDRC